MGGKSKAEGQAGTIAARQSEGSEADRASAEAYRKQMDEYLKPAIEYNRVLATGNKDAAMTASAPLISGITSASRANKEAIYDNVPAGAARDFALASNDLTTRSNVAATLSQKFIEAQDKLANIGSGLGSFSLQTLGSSLRGAEGAANTNSTVMQAEQQRKASTMGFLGGLAGAGGQFAGAKWGK